MEAFSELRRQARIRRDKALQKAQDDYAATLGRIAVLHQDLLGRHPATHKSDVACVQSVIPSDHPFTVAELLTALEALDPARVWRKRTVDNQITKLRARGLVRRLRKPRLGEPALYVRADVPVEPEPFQDLTLPDALAQVLAGKPLNLTELVVALLDAGYHTRMKRRQFRNTVGAALRGDQGRFVLVAGKWTVSAAS